VIEYSNVCFTWSFDGLSISISIIVIAISNFLCKRKKYYKYFNVKKEDKINVMNNVDEMQSFF